MSQREKDKHCTSSHAGSEKNKLTESRGEATEEAAGKGGQRDDSLGVPVVAQRK